jgi:predicted DNA binding CopG/RHH family protein
MHKAVFHIKILTPLHTCITDRLWNLSGAKPKTESTLKNMASLFMTPNMPLPIPSALSLKMWCTVSMKSAFFASVKQAAALPLSDSFAENKKFASLAPAIGGKEKSFMKKRIKYTDEPSDVDLDAAQAVKDFLPPPDQLVFKEKTVKITLSLSEDSVNFFKAQAGKHGLKYQQMIRSLIDKYVSAHTHSA